MKRLWIAIVRLFGWKFDMPDPSRKQEIDRCVIIMAPHTSALDFYIGASCVWKLGINARIFIKREYFNWLTKPILEYFGAVAVDRGNRHNGLVKQAVDMYSKNERFTMVITPEGTRKAVKKWKRGFYEIATQANVPIVLSYVDFKSKHLGIGPTLHPTGDYEEDMKTIKQFYSNVTAKHPENFNKDIC